MSSSEASLVVLFEELSGIKLDIIGLIEVRSTHEAYTVLKKGHVLCYLGLMYRRELGVGLVINKDIAGNIEEFYSMNDRVAGLPIHLIRGTN